MKTWKEVHFEGEYFGSPEYDVGITGLSWKFRWKALAVSPWMGVGFGRGAQTAPVFTFRWNYETHRWFSQGFFAHSLTAHAYQPESETEGAPLESVAVHTSILSFAVVAFSVFAQGLTMASFLRRMGEIPR